MIINSDNLIDITVLITQLSTPLMLGWLLGVKIKTIKTFVEKTS